MSDLLIPIFGEWCEGIAQVAYQKWATMSELLRSLTKNERMSQSLVYLSESLICSFFRKKRAIRSENPWANSQPCFLDQTAAAGYRFEISPVSQRSCAGAGFIVQYGKISTVCWVSGSNAISCPVRNVLAPPPAVSSQQPLRDITPSQGQRFPFQFPFRESFGKVLCMNLAKKGYHVFGSFIYFSMRLTKFYIFIVLLSLFLFVACFWQRFIFLRMIWQRFLIFSMFLATKLLLAWIWQSFSYYAFYKICIFSMLLATFSIFNMLLTTFSIFNMLLAKFPFLALLLAKFLYF